ncbi:MAG: hypothetical protein QOJ99_831, partial [Bryobacterales bacterium]|nr:hypothetical protein [Bryobacterales bacterium]
MWAYAGELVLAVLAYIAARLWLGESVVTNLVRRARSDWIALFAVLLAWALGMIVATFASVLTQPFGEYLQREHAAK